MANNRMRIPSTTIVLPPGKAFFAVTHPDKAENKFDPANKNWSIRVVWDGENRKKVEQLLGPLVPAALDAKKAELIAEAQEKGDKIKEKKAGEMESEVPWREVLDRETAEPTGEIEIVFKRPEMRLNRSAGTKVKNSPPLVIDAQRATTSEPIPNRAIVAVKMATWPVYFAADNKAGIKRLLEAVQIISMPEARKPDADGFDTFDDGYKADADGASQGGEAPVAASGSDY